jgi:thiosulfate reductase cytochrome b subunit
MAGSAYFPGLEIRSEDIPDSPRHSVMVRITHWINMLSFVGLLVSGFAILLAHPRLYWGEAGNVGTPSLIDLPLPFVLTGQTGWGRSLHFLSAWACVLNGSLYVISGLLTQHFRRDLLPGKPQYSSLCEIPVHAASAASYSNSGQTRLKPRVPQGTTILSERYSGKPQRPAEGEPLTYNVPQRLTYLVVIAVLFPLMIWTGFAMSPAITSVLPDLVTALGGQQSARTIHFFAAGSLVLFLLVHVAMVWRSGFKNHVRAMITGKNRT